ncbi:MAG: IPT/TIG domain-containing protein [Acidobacteriia bacterium]|nr:IPT/TIG domain-containing protein [Terriglobia bacterium]
MPRIWVSIYGNNLAPGSATWTGNFPVSLGSTSVTIDGKPDYLWFVSPTQITVQAPDDTATGTVPVVVTTAMGKRPRL